jgi:hypothetical protein
MSYTFFRWVRYGVAAALSDEVLETGGGPRARVTVGVDVSATGLTARQATLPIDVLGPGDVSGIDHRQVTRTFPVPNTPDFESQYLAHVEFDRPDLPWLFTPSPADAAGTLRPWICLAVIEKRDGVKLEQGSPLPRLTIANNAGAELPDLASVHLWTHVQVTGAVTSGLDAIAADTPERIISRLVCARALQGDTAYLACVVPTFNVGVKAGLGIEVAPDAVLGDAWTPATASIQLPVYHHWEFATGRSGDFKSLVTKLQARNDLQGVGTRPLDITTPGFGVDDRTDYTSVQIGGALRVTAPDPPPVDESLADDLATALAQDGVTPPIYGRWHAGQTGIVRAEFRPRWLEALNLDVRYRVAAGLGTQVVQERQEDLMAAIWEQFGEILRANQLLRHAQLAIAASERVVARHLVSLPDLDLLSVAAPASGRIRMSTQRTMRRAVAESCTPVLAFSGAFRRLVRTRGPLGRRMTRLERPGMFDIAPPPAVEPSSLLASLASGIWNVRKPSVPDGAIAAPVSWSRVKMPPGHLLGELAPIFQRLALADRTRACPALDPGGLAVQVRNAITPDVAIMPRVRAQIALPSSSRLHLSDRLDPVMAAPEIPTPMIGPLLERGQDWLLPGLENVPRNTVTIVEPDAAFIEAYMVGLNHEIGREMLWRGFPTDQRGTVFARFWDRRGAVASAGASIPARDIPAVAGWKGSDDLGSHLDASGIGLVLLIRGDLLVRYPLPTVFLQRAKWRRDPVSNAIVMQDGVAVREPVSVGNQADWTAHVHFPSMTGQMGSDTSYFGFPLPRASVHGRDRTGLPANASDADAGWYVVFQEQATQPRFGYSPTPPAIPPGVNTPEDLAATMLRKPFRLFVHGSDLVGA